jgi:hypothetical protein
VAAFREKDGSPAGEIKVKEPHFVGVDSRSGAVYALCGPNANQPVLVKFAGIKSGREVCRVTLPAASHLKSLQHRIAVDSSGKAPRIWTVVKRYRAERICYVDDLGGKLEIHDKMFFNPLAKGGRDLSMDRRRGELYAEVRSSKSGYVRINEKTGKVEQLGPNGWARKLGWGAYQVVVCEDGSLVSLGAACGLKRWTRDGKPLPWDGTKKNTWEPTGVAGVLMTLEPTSSLAVFKNEVYVTPPVLWRTGKLKAWNAGGHLSFVNVHGMDGKIRRTVIWQCMNRSVLRVDSKGNIYLAGPVRPGKRVDPKFFDGKPKHKHKWYDPYSYIYGSIVKFPARGGAVWYDKDFKGDRYRGKRKVRFPAGSEGKIPKEVATAPEVKMHYTKGGRHELKPVTVQGAEWVRFGFSPFSCKFNAGGLHCHCSGSGFDIDEFGRVFYPNMGQFRVEMVDTDNNWIGTFGRYGNVDDSEKAWEKAKSGTETPRTDVPLCWPTYVAVSDKYAYVQDVMNQRIVRLKLGYAAEKSCAVR